MEAKENSYRALGVNATALTPASAAMEAGEESSEESSSEGRARTVRNVVCKSLSIRRSRAAAELRSHLKPNLRWNRKIKDTQARNRQSAEENVPSQWIGTLFQRAATMRKARTLEMTCLLQQVPLARATTGHTNATIRLSFVFNFFL